MNNILDKVDQICRICLEEGEMRNIFEKTIILNDNLDLPSTIFEHTAVKIDKDDRLPDRICLQCLKELYTCYMFRLKCQNSQKTLEEYISKIVLEQESSEKIITDDATETRSFVEVAGCTDDLTLKDVDHKNENITLENNKEEAVSQDVVDDDSDSDKELLEPMQKKIKIKKILYDKIKEDIDDEIEKRVDEALALEANKKRIIGKTKIKPCLQRCGYCNIYFVTIEDLFEHFKRMKHPQEYTSKLNDLCLYCNKTFKRGKLKPHLRTHTQEKPFVCEICGQRFSLHSNLKRHTMTHTGDKPHKCDTCGKAFIQKPSLIEHVRTHTGEKPYVCYYCGKRFGQSSQYNMHIRRHEIEEGIANKTGDNMEYSCIECGKVFLSKGTLKTHALLHGERKFLCPYCGKSCTTKQGLESHTKVHTGAKPYTCKWCDKAFSQLGSLKSHLFIHKGIKPHTCKICSKAFTQRSHLIYHQRIHTGEKPYSCEVCDKSFSLKGTLTVHKRIHTGETPYHCPVCDKGFHDSSSMKKHQKSHSDSNSD